MSKASKNTSHRKLFTVGSDAPFQFVEAYKSLRTNLEFLSSAGNCKINGINGELRVNFI